jgi:catechol 2,3-dioxygenase-like lactoylglutathione lyase family enzyme
MIRLMSLVLVVRNLDRALGVYEQGLGFTRLGDPEDVPSLGARHVILRADNCTLELLEPHDERMPPGIFLRARGEGVFAMELGSEDPTAVRTCLEQVPVEVRGTGERGRLFVRPNDAHGVLVEVGRTSPSA